MTNLVKTIRIVKPLLALTGFFYLAAFVVAQEGPPDFPNVWINIFFPPRPSGALQFSADIGSSDQDDVVAPSSSLVLSTTGNVFDVTPNDEIGYFRFVAAEDTNASQGLEVFAAPILSGPQPETDSFIDLDQTLLPGSGDPLLEFVTAETVRFPLGELVTAIDTPGTYTFVLNPDAFRQPENSFIMVAELSDCGEPGNTCSVTKLITMGRKRCTPVVAAGTFSVKGENFSISSTINIQHAGRNRLTPFIDCWNPAGDETRVLDLVNFSGFPGFFFASVPPMGATGSAVVNTNDTPFVGACCADSTMGPFELTNSFDTCVETETGCDLLGSAGFAATEPALKHVLGIVRTDTGLDTSFAVFNPFRTAVADTLVSVFDGDTEELVCEAKNNLTPNPPPAPLEGFQSASRFWWEACGLSSPPANFNGWAVIISNRDLVVNSLFTLDGVQQRSLTGASP